MMPVSLYFKGMNRYAPANKTLLLCCGLVWRVIQHFKLQYILVTEVEKDSPACLTLFICFYISASSVKKLKDSTGCDLCKFVVNYMDNFLEQNSTEVTFFRFKIKRLLLNFFKCYIKPFCHFDSN